MASTSPQGYLSIAPSTTYVLPSQLVLGSQGAGDFIVTNNTDTARSFGVINLPRGVERMAATGAANDCGTADQTVSIPGKGTCTLRLGFTATKLGVNSFSGPQLCADKNVSYTCTSIPKTIITAAVAPNKKTILGVTSGNSVFAPGETSQYEIKNTGQFPANNVRLHFSQNFQKYITSDSVTIDPTLAAGDSVTLKVTLKKNAPLNGLDSRVTIQAGNSDSTYQSAKVVKSLLTISPAVFVKPGEAAIHITNNGPLSVTGLLIEDITGMSQLSGVKKITSTNPCGSTLDSGASCEVLYSVKADAHGSAKISVTFKPYGQEQKIIYTCIFVRKANIVINPDTNDYAQAVRFNLTAGSGSFLIKNTSPFTWFVPKVTLKGRSDIVLNPGASQSGDCSLAGSPDGVLGGQTCLVRYTVSTVRPLAAATTTGSVEASGSNATTTSVSASSSTSDITITQDTNNQHLGAINMLLTNNTSGNVKISALSVTPTATNDYVTYCGSSASACSVSYASTSACAVGTTISQGESCNLWFEADSADSLLGAQAIGEKIVASLSDASTQATYSANYTVNFTYQNLLYAGGDFTIDNQTGSDSQGIEATNGATWLNTNSSSNLGLSGTVYALQYYDGDLYLGGDINIWDAKDAVSNTVTTAIGRWNGHNMYTMADTQVRGVVKALTVYNNDLVVGGDFFAQPSAGLTDDIIYWNGTSWGLFNVDGISSDTTNSSVNALAVDPNGDLVVGGTFQDDSKNICTTSQNLYFFAQWNATASTKCWQSHTLAQASTSFPSVVWSDVNDTVSAFSNSSSYLFAGGVFTQAIPSASLFQNSEGGPIDAMHLSGYSPSGANEWNGSAGQTYDSNFAGAGQDVYALAYANNTLYVGGIFSQMTSEGAVGPTYNINNVGAVNTTNNVVSAVSTGLDDTVYALQALGDKVYAGGLFSTNADRVAVYNGTSWASLAGGIDNGSVYALAIAPSLVEDSIVNNS